MWHSSLLDSTPQFTPCLLIPTGLILKIEEKDLKLWNEAEEEIEDRDGDIQKQNELKELELKNSDATIFQLSPKSQSTSTSDTDEKVVHTSQFTDTLVTSGNGEKKEDNLMDKSEDSENFDLDDTIGNIV